MLVFQFTHRAYQIYFKTILCFFSPTKTYLLGNHILKKSGLLLLVGLITDQAVASVNQILILFFLIILTKGSAASNHMYNCFPYFDVVEESFSA